MALFEAAALAFVNGASAKAGSLLAGLGWDRAKDALAPDIYESAAAQVVEACTAKFQAQADDGKVVIQALLDTFSSTDHAEKLGEALTTADPTEVHRWFTAQDARVVPYLHQFLVAVGHAMGDRLGGDQRRLWVAIESTLAQTRLALWEQRTRDRDKSRPRLSLGARRRKEALGDPLHTALTAHTEASPFLGRQPELAALRAWLDDDQERLSLRVITGRGGAGKTRLALHLAREALRRGWHAGFIADPAELEREDLGRWELETHTLVIVDYAAGRAAQVANWLRSFPDQWFETPPAPGRMRLRVLLLERQGGQWLDPVLAAAEGIQRPIPIALGGFAPADRVALFRWALTEHDASCASLLAGHPDFAKAMDGANWKDEPLYLIMAGLIAAESRSIHAALNLSRGQLAYWRATGTEVRRVDAIAPGATALARHLVAAVTLCRGITVGNLKRIIPAERAALGQSGLETQWADELSWVRDVLAPGAPRDDDTHVIPPIEPDVIGEMFILCYLQDWNPANASSSVIRLDALTAQDPDIAATLIRMTQDYFDQPAIAGEGGRPGLTPGRCSRALHWLNRLATSQREFHWLHATADAFPDQVTDLRPPALRVNEARNKLLRTAVAGMEAPGQPEVAELARSLNNLANRQSEAGEREAALVTAKEAVEKYRVLAAGNPQAFTPALAMGLNNLAIRQSEAGEWAAALVTAKEAAEKYRGLAAGNLQAFTPALATSLNNLANRQSEAGEWEAALVTAKEAVELRRGLAAGNPQAFTPALATSLNNLAIRQSEAGEWAAALVTAKEGVELRRGLAAGNPQAFTPDLAASLNNLAAMQSEAGDREAALVTAKEAVEKHRGLAAGNPQAFTPALGMSLGALGQILTAAGQHKDAQAAFREGVERLSPAFLAFPLGHAALTEALASEYRAACEALGQTPDEALLAPIAAALERLQQAGPPTS
ncbi:MAG: tetratricopeptide repeat protein [Dehalococcoidia bacterium]